MSTRLDGRVAVITGAGGGLGRAYAKLFTRLGAQVVINDIGTIRSDDGQEIRSADDAVAAVRADGGQAVANYGDITKPDEARHLIHQAIDEFGRIDIVVNNASLLRRNTFTNMTAEEFRLVVDVNLFGSFNVTHAAWSHLMRQNYGRVLFTTSGSAHNGSTMQANYGAAKLALVGLMNNLIAEGTPNNVLVNSISPAATTQMTSHLSWGELEPFLGAETVAPLAAWLVSESCSDAGMIVSAHAGLYARVHYFQSEGVLFDAREPISVDMVSAVSDEITSLDDAKPVGPRFMSGISERLGSAGFLG